jgi:hypothetical protein
MEVHVNGKWRTLGVLVLSCGLALTGCNGKKDVTPDQSSAQKPVYMTIDIWDKGQGPTATTPRLKRNKDHWVRWVNHTDQEFLLVPSDDVGTGDDDNGPFPELMLGVWVGPNSATADFMSGYYSINERKVNNGKVVLFKYKSTKAKLEGDGGPGEPGMVVED